MTGPKPYVLGIIALLALASACGSDDDPTGPGGNGTPNLAPTVEITSPSTGSTSTAGQIVIFTGTATDPEDGLLAGEAMAWSSNRDGALGTGSSLSVNDLSIGTHAITLTATDSEFKSASVGINVIVNPVPELPPVPSTEILLQNDMDDENGGVATPNFTDFTAWTVERGCVDLHGPGATDPVPGNGLYIDLDGTDCFLAGMLVSREEYDLQPGTYALEFVMAGNSQVEQTDTLHIAVGSVFAQTIVLPWTAPFEIRTYTFTVAEATTGRIVLDHEGGDEQGILIDAARLRKEN